jgi:hypothetical protein
MLQLLSIAAGIGVVSSSGGAALSAEVKAPRHFVINVTTRCVQHFSLKFNTKLAVYKHVSCSTDHAARHTTAASAIMLQP